MNDYFRRYADTYRTPSFTARVSSEATVAKRMLPERDIDWTAL
jgi:hypothetical protein